MKKIFLTIISKVRFEVFHNLLTKKKKIPLSKSIQIIEMVLQLSSWRIRYFALLKLFCGPWWKLIEWDIRLFFLCFVFFFFFFGKNDPEVPEV